MRKTALALLLIMATVCGLSVEARASFIGAYDPSNWTSLQVGPTLQGSVNTGGAPDSIVINGGNAGCSSDHACVFSFTIAAAGTGSVSFKWHYVSQDTGSNPALLDDFGRLLNGVPTQHSLNFGLADQSGTDSFAVTAGNIFGFYLDCVDCVNGPANVTIAEFSAPSDPNGPDLAATPEPATLLLFGTSLVGMAAAWRRRRQ